MTAFVYICSFRKFPDRQILVACFPVAFLNGKPELSGLKAYDAS